MPVAWTFAVARDDLGRTAVVESELPVPAAGEALLRVDRVGLTANNITYAVLGVSMRYWEFFPPRPRGLGPQWGLPPLWGFAEVVASRAPGVEAGQRVYGYLPPASHLLVRPDRVDATGFRDGAEHRAGLPSPYNAYRSLAASPVRDDVEILFRPLFFTSFMLADQLADNGFHGASALLLSSASSKTAYAAAFELHGRGPRLIGLTSPGNLEFTRSLGCYDDVVSYDDLGFLPVAPTVYLDLSGSPETRAAVRRHFGERLVRDIAVGLTNQIANADAAEEVFFAPVQMRKRGADWGREELDRRFAKAWQRFAAAAEGWLDVRVGVGRAGLQDAWLDVLSGRAPAREARIVQISAVGA